MFFKLTDIHGISRNLVELLINRILFPAAPFANMD